MSAATNKAMMQAIFAEMEKGNREPFGAAMAENFTWHMMGSTSWSGSYKGRDSIRTMLLRPLFARFEGPYRNRAIRMVAEDDIVVVECRGQVRTTEGKDYNNQYCFIFRIADGKIAELTEYLDTALVDAALGERDDAVAALKQSVSA